MKSFRFVPFVLAAALMAGPSVHADEIALDQNASKVHMVAGGDTLWDIATTYMEDPFKWPKIWGFNNQVMNPDLIFPGGEIRIPVALLKPEIRKKIVQQKKYDFGYEPIVVVSAPRGILNPALVEAGGYIIDKIHSVGKVLGVQEDRVMLGEGDTVFVKLSRKANAVPGTKFQVVRKVRTVRHPKTFRKVGQLVRILGMIEVTARDGNIYTAHLSNTYDYVTAGDKLIPYVQPDVDVIERDPQLSGRIIALQEDRAMSGDEDVLYLDRGSSEGLGPGMTMKVTREGSRLDPTGMWGTYDLPDRTIAELTILSVREHNATAWVRHSTEPIQVGDQFHSQPPNIREQDKTYVAGSASASGS